MRHVGQTIAVATHDPPAEIARSGIDTEHQHVGVTVSRDAGPGQVRSGYLFSADAFVKAKIVPTRGLNYGRPHLLVDVKLGNPAQRFFDYARRRTPHPRVRRDMYEATNW